MSARITSGGSVGKFEGKVAIVTGGSRGIGRATVVRLAAEGAHVVFTYKSNQEAAAETEALVKAAGGTSLAVCADVSDPEAAERIVKDTVAAHGRIDILISNAGIVHNDLMMRMSLAHWREVIDTNLSGAYFMAQAVTRPMLKAKRGRIIFITSVVGQAGNAAQTNYAASKAGLIGLTMAAARELGSRNITVNAVAPGAIDTDMNAPYRAEIEAAVSQAPLGRIGTPEDVAGAVSFLASDDASYITGQVLAVDGGLVMR
jgi:3-oxoacyl-[acyl-carrier protein] reductase